jgi:hypothetical protein
MVNQPIVVLYVVLIIVVVVTNAIILQAQFELRHRHKSAINSYLGVLAFSELFFVVWIAVGVAIEAIVVPISSSTIAVSVTCFVVPYFRLFCECFNVFCMIAVAFDLFRTIFWPTCVNASSRTCDRKSEASNVACGSLPSTVASWQYRRRRIAVSVIIASILSAGYSLRAFATSYLEYNQAMVSSRKSGKSTSAQSHVDTQSEGTQAGSWSVNVTAISFSGSHTVTVPEATAELCSVFNPGITVLLPILLLDVIVLFLAPFFIQLILYAISARKLCSHEVGEL